MAILPFPNEWLTMPDAELGRRLLDSFVYAQTVDLGLPVDQIPEAFVERVRQYILTIETKLARSAALEKALHKAALGDFETAGRFLREHMTAGAVAMKFIPIGVNRSRQAMEFGKVGANKKRATSADNRQKVLTAAQVILAGRTRKPTQRALAGLIAETTNISANTVRGHLAALRKAKILD